MFNMGVYGNATSFWNCDISATPQDFRLPSKVFRPEPCVLHCFSFSLTSGQRWHGKVQSERRLTTVTTEVVLECPWSFKGRGLIFMRVFNLDLTVCQSTVAWLCDWANHVVTASLKAREHIAQFCKTWGIFPGFFFLCDCLVFISFFQQVLFRLTN